MDATPRVSCDFEGCPVTFGRQQDQDRHKREVHGESKLCPWCTYTTRRDGRLHDHMDENHRPRKHKSRLSVDSAGLSLPKRIETSQVKVEEPHQSMECISFHGQDTAFDRSISGVSPLQPRNKRAKSHQPSSSIEDQLIPSPQLFISSSYQTTSPVEQAMNRVDDRSFNPRLPIRSHSSIDSKNPSAANVNKTFPNSLLKSPQSSSKHSADMGYSPRMSNNMSTTRHGSSNQGVEPDLPQIFQSPHYQRPLESTPMSSSAYAPQVQTYDLPTGVNSGSPHSNLPLFGAAILADTQLSRAYLSMSTDKSSPATYPSYPQNFGSNGQAQLATSHCGQNDGFEYLTEEEYWM